MLRVKYDDSVKKKCRYGTKNSAGMDIATVEPVVVPPGCYKKIRTGVYVAIPAGWYGLLTHRSGLNAKRGGWAHGIIDADYRGELIVTLFNHDPSQEIRLDEGEYFAQLVVSQCMMPEFMKEVTELDETERGEGRHGSTDE